MTAYNEDIEREQFKLLKGKHKHYCPEWDYMAIDETCPEYKACLCEKQNETKSSREE